MKVLIEGSTEFLKMRELTTVSLIITSRALIFDQTNTVEPTFTLSYAPIVCLSKDVDNLVWVSIILRTSKVR